MEPSECEHPITARRIDIFRTAVPRDHPGYRESRRETCTACMTQLREDS